MTAEPPGDQVPQRAPHVLLQALPSRSSLTPARTEAASPGAAPTLHLGGRFSPTRPKPSHVFLQAGSPEPWPGAERDFSRPTATYCQQLGTAGLSAESLWSCEVNGLTSLTSSGPGLCLAQPEYNFVLSTMLQLCGSNSSGPPEALVLRLARLVVGWLEPYPTEAAY